MVGVCTTLAGMRRCRANARGLALAFGALLLADLVLPADAAAYQRGRGRRAEPEATATLSRRPEGPVKIIISIGSQRLWVYDNAGLLETSIVSTGTGGFPTPTGVFAIIDKEVQHYSNIYGGASMPYMQRLTMSGVALHSGVTTGRPASHGCIRLPHAFAIKLFKITGLGTRVVIVPDEPVPAEFAHARLFVKKPAPTIPAEDAAREAAKPIGIATANALEVDKGIVDARLGKITAWRWQMLSALPISVFVSKAQGKVLVRHGFQPLFEAPATFRDPDRLLGTHVLTAVTFKDDDGRELRWTAVSMPAEPHGSAPVRSATRGRMRGEPEPDTPASVGPPSSVAEALDRIELPQEAIDRISELISPGATLIISDHGHNREMRQSGTDFIVLTR
jgi:L,D-transpeptidase catalytic domain